MGTRLGGVALQLNPTWVNQIGLEHLEGLSYDYAELLCDSFAGALDAPYVLEPGTRALIDQIGEKKQVIAHGNYGSEFGFEPLEDTGAVKRHIAIAREMKSPWYADHMFFGDRASTFMWSSPLQFSKAEIERVAGRAAAMQDMLKMPLLHENAFYYARFPGSTLAEVDFISEIITRAGTHSLLDLHNVYANSMNFPEYDRWHFLKTLPLDRVVEIHLAGGQYFGDWYHDFHNHGVPEGVWEMLEYVVPRATNLECICLEVQGPEHCSGSRQVDLTWIEMMKIDLDRSKAIWTKYKEPANS
jgi:uncharacterized protein